MSKLVTICKIYWIALWSSIAFIKLHYALLTQSILDLTDIKERIVYFLFWNLQKHLQTDNFWTLTPGYIFWISSLVIRFVAKIIKENSLDVFSSSNSTSNSTSLTLTNALSDSLSRILSPSLIGQVSVLDIL
jgi:hypothetical protein